jgi:hypothetical protein
MRHASMSRQWWWHLGAVAVALTMVAFGRTEAQAPPQKPNILVIWGDDIGTWNISHNSRGMMAQ